MFYIMAHLIVQQLKQTLKYKMEILVSDTKKSCFFYL